MHLSENQTNIHIEARVNWDIKNIPQGAPLGGFIPYLYINAKVVNQTNGLSTFIDLLPHINLIDNFHYARNIALPGSVDDLYSVEFNIIAPAHTELALHRDWIEQYKSFLNEEFNFFYKNNFQINNTSPVIIHKLSHQKLHIKFFHVACDKVKSNAYKLFNKDQLLQLPVSKVIENYLSQSAI